MSWAEIKKALNSDLSKSLDTQLNKNVDVPLNYLLYNSLVGASVEKVGYPVEVSAIKFHISEHTSPVGTSTNYKIIETTAPTILYALIVQISQEGGSNKTMVRIALNNSTFQTFALTTSGSSIDHGTGGFIVGDVIQPIYANSGKIQLPLYASTDAATGSGSSIYNSYTNMFTRIAERESSMFANNGYNSISSGFSCHKNLPKPVYSPGGFSVFARNGYSSSSSKATVATVYVYAVYQTLN